MSHIKNATIYNVGGTWFAYVDPLERYLLSEPDIKQVERNLGSLENASVQINTDYFPAVKVPNEKWCYVVKYPKIFIECPDCKWPNNGHNREEDDNPDWSGHGYKNITEVKPNIIEDNPVVSVNYDVAEALRGLMIHVFYNPCKPRYLTSSDQWFADEAWAAAKKVYHTIK